MGVQIRERAYYNKGVRVDDEHLKRIESIIRNEWQEAYTKLTVFCENVEIDYNEMSDFSSGIQDNFNIIDRLRIVYYKETRSYGAEIEIEYSNGTSVFDYPIKIHYSADNAREYTVLRNSIDQYIKTSFLSYAILSRTPIAFTLAATIAVGLVTMGFFERMEPTVIVATVIGLADIGFLGSYKVIRRLKRMLFPLNEIYFGVNKREIDRGHKARGYLLGTVVLSIIVGLVVNLISKYIIG